MKRSQYKWLKYTLFFVSLNALYFFAANFFSSRALAFDTTLHIGNTAPLVNSGSTYGGNRATQPWFAVGTGDYNGLVSDAKIYVHHGSTSTLYVKKGEGICNYYDQATGSHYMDIGYPDVRYRVYGLRPDHVHFNASATSFKANSGQCGGDVTFQLGKEVHSDGPDGSTPKGQDKFDVYYFEAIILNPPDECCNEKSFRLYADNYSYVGTARSLKYDPSSYNAYFGIYQRDSQVRYGSQFWNFATQMAPTCGGEPNPQPKAIGIYDIDYGIYGQDHLDAKILRDVRDDPGFQWVTALGDITERSYTGSPHAFVGGNHQNNPLYYQDDDNFRYLLEFRGVAWQNTIQVWFPWDQFDADSSLVDCKGPPDYKAACTVTPAEATREINTNITINLKLTNTGGTGTNWTSRFYLKDLLTDQHYTIPSNLLPIRPGQSYNVKINRTSDTVGDMDQRTRFQMMTTINGPEESIQATPCGPLIHWVEKPPQQGGNMTVTCHQVNIFGLETTERHENMRWMPDGSADSPRPGNVGDYSWDCPESCNYYDGGPGGSCEHCDAYNPLPPFECTSHHEVSGCHWTPHWQNTSRIIRFFDARVDILLSGRVVAQKTFVIHNPRTDFNTDWSQDLEGNYWKGIDGGTPWTKNPETDGKAMFYQFLTFPWNTPDNPPTSSALWPHNRYTFKLYAAIHSSRLDLVDTENLDRCMSASCVANGGLAGDLDLEPGENRNLQFLMNYTNQTNESFPLNSNRAYNMDYVRNPRLAGGVIVTRWKAPPTLPADFSGQLGATFNFELDYEGQVADVNLYWKGGVLGPPGPANPCTSIVYIPRTRPYIKIYSGDVIAGGVFADAAGVCDSSKVRHGGIHTYARPTAVALPEGGSGKKGSSSDFAAYALGFIDGTRAGPWGFYDSADNGGNYNALSFANTGDHLSSELKGGYAAGYAPSANPGDGPAPSKFYCPMDYFDNTAKIDNVSAHLKPVSSVDVTNPTATPVDGINVPGQFYYTAAGGKVDLHQDLAGVTHSETIYVEGNVWIRENITLHPWNPNKPGSIPYFALIVKGNIFVDPAVSELDGLYVAQNTNGTDGMFATCSVNGTSPADETAIVTKCYQDQLVVDGAVIAEHVKLGRSHGTLWRARGKNIEIGDNFGIAGENAPQAAEIFNYTPSLLFGLPEFRSLNGGAVVPSSNENVIGLPPVF